MKVKYLEELKTKIRPLLSKYLKEMGMSFSHSHFQCPNYEVHSNDDKKPSASFYPDDGHFKCFACNVAGDIFHATHYLEGKPLEGPEFITENVLYLAKRFKIPYELVNVSPLDKKYAKVYEILKIATAMMKLAVKAKVSKRVDNYIKSRGWEGLTDVFDFGFCNYDKLIVNLKKKGYTTEDIKDAGLDQKGLLNNRLVMPIKDAYGRIIGFASRRIVEDDLSYPKYMNSSVTKLYKKSDVFFNLDKAKNEDTLYVVEGYGDVFTLYKEGIKNVVALCDLSFSSNRYVTLVKNKVKKITVCLDNDDRGQEALRNMIAALFVKRSEIKVSIKHLEDAKDPDEYVKKYGIEKFKGLPETELFDFLLEDYINDVDNIDKKNTIFTYIIIEESFIVKEQMCRKLGETLNPPVSADTIVKEVAKYENEKSQLQQIKQADILKEKMEFANEIDNFDEWAWKRGQLLGLDTGYPIFNEKMDGLQSGLHIIAGKPNVGKTAMCLSLMYKIVKNNQNIFALYFSIDDSTRQIIPRLLAAESGIQINWISNPKHRIQEANDIAEEQVNTLLERREKALNDLKDMSNFLVVKDASKGVTVEYVEKALQLYKIIAGDKQLIVFIDSLHKMETETRKEGQDKYIHISKSLKKFSTVYDIPIVTVAELKKKKDAGVKPSLEDIKETIDFAYDATVVMMLHNDMDENENSPFHHLGENDRIYPVIEVRFIKNKSSDFKGKLYYKFYPELSKFAECTRDRMNYFRSCYKRKKTKG